MLIRLSNKIPDSGERTVCRETRRLTWHTLTHDIKEQGAIMVLKGDNRRFEQNICIRLQFVSTKE